MIPLAMTFRDAFKEAFKKDSCVCTVLSGIMEDNTIIVGLDQYGYYQNSDNEFTDVNGKVLEDQTKPVHIKRVEANLIAERDPNRKNANITEPCIGCKAIFTKMDDNGWGYVHSFTKVSNTKHINKSGKVGFQVNDNGEVLFHANDNKFPPVDGITKEEQVARVLYVREDGQIVMNNGALGGLIKIDNLVKTINRLVSEVDDLRKAHNELLAKYLVHVHPLVLSSDPTKPFPLAISVPILPEVPPLTPITNPITRVHKGKNISSNDGRGDDLEPVSYTHLTLPTICSV